MNRLDLKQSSPILRHALESFEHGIGHYIGGGETDRKFAYLHIDHSIELILKEKMREKGISIYKGNTETYNIHECITNLERNNITIPEKANIELLHDNRNAIQHKGFSPDEDTTRFEISQCYYFFKRFLKEELNRNIEDLLPKRYIDLIEGRTTIPTDEINIRIEGAKERYEKKDYLGSILLSRMSLELQIKKLLAPFVKSGEIDTIQFYELLALLNKKKVFSNAEYNNIIAMSQIRNKAVHTGYIPSEYDAEVAMEITKMIQEKISTSVKEKEQRELKESEQ